MAPKPNPEMDERISIPLDPELAIRALLEVDPKADPADDQPSALASADDKKT